MSSQHQRNSVTLPTGAKDFSQMARFGDWPGSGMSNFDHTIEDGFEAHLRAGGWGTYSGWNFNGSVWFEDGKFRCEVWQWHELKEVIEVDVLDDLIDAVSKVYGYE